MAERNVDKLYSNLIKKEARTKPKTRAQGAGSERRQAPRLESSTTMLTVRTEAQVAPIDISISGMAFHSRFPVYPGQPLHITISTVFSVDAEVVSCTPEKNPDSDTQEFKVQCRFPEEEQGKYLLVAIKELESQKEGGK